MPPSHAPVGYDCPFCAVVRGDAAMFTRQQHVVARSEDMVAFVASHWWPANPGHVLVVPVRHIENLYEFPATLGASLMDMTRRIAVALKDVFSCEGVSTRQHNEPAGGQDVWHFHQHVFPRWPGDQLYARHEERSRAPEAELLHRAAALRDFMDGESRRGQS